ncbi:MAG: glutaredoxin family protein [Nitrosomonas sp.]|nr:MAG: glutaredoxin family protein [Nitrosomonas sp.]
MTRKIDTNSSDGEGEIFILYGREECHLCQDMLQALQQLQLQLDFKFALIDIDSDTELIARYGEKIPVLVSSLTRQEICHYHLDRAVLDAYLDKFR